MDEFDELLVTARAAHVRGDWHAAHRQFSRARALSELGTTDLSLLGSGSTASGFAQLDEAMLPVLADQLRC